MDINKLTDDQLSELKQKISKEESDREKRKMDDFMADIQNVLQKHEFSERALLDELAKRCGVFIIIPR